MKELTKSKVVLHCIALFAIMFFGNFMSSLPWDILFRFIKLPYNWMYGALRIISCIGLTVFLFYHYSKRIFHCQFSFFRIGTFRITVSNLIFALLLPTIVILSYICLGKIYVSNDLTGSAVLSTILLALFRALNAGILEEMLFRGFILKLVETKWNKSVAILAPSFIFSLAHIPSMQTFSPIGLFLLICSGTLVGVMFSLITYQNNSVWSSALTHAIWNFTIISDLFYFGNQVNHNAIFSIVFSSENPILTGGDFGIEASIIAIAAYLTISIMILLCMKCTKQNK